MRHISLVIAALLLAGCSVQAPAPSDLPHADLIRIEAPRPGAVVPATFSVTGEARGTWYFEATFPFAVEAADGTVLGQSYATAQGEWMTEDFVPFFGEISLSVPSGTEAVLVVSNSNASGLPEYAKEVRIPIRIGE